MPATSLTEFTPAAFEPEPMAPPVTKLGFVGQGDVMKRFGPALVAIGRRVDGVVVCSLEAESRLTGFAHEYYQVSADNLLPWHTLAARGYLSAVTAWANSSEQSICFPQR